MVDDGLRLDVERVVRVLGRVSGGGKKRRVSCDGAPCSSRRVMVPS
jgi:hypothetical protein